ncbi:aldehyde dehydrogenase [Bacterioplanoides sp.]|uniref:aldehyde dehydrogenase n=1 Tax=Bacterioplanoides sp. TaxID=2066072 RepID=UPI003B001B43
MNSRNSFQDWQRIAQQLTFPQHAFIHGQAHPAASGAVFDVVSPRDGQRLTQLSACDEQDADIAVQSSRAAFEQGVWSQISAKQRKHTMLAWANLVEQHAEELALLETLDMGMTISDSTQMNIPGAIECIRWFAELADKQYDEIAPTAPNALTRIHRVPVGVVAAVVPWNYPLMIACWKAAPALAIGNSVILKPAEQASLATIRLAELAFEAGIPAGVLNVLTGLGDQAGKALGLHMDVDALAFTGSTRVGGLYMQYAGQSNLKRVSLECGGKTPNIVLADCPDLDKAAAAIVLGAFGNSGQICNAGSRLIVERSVHAELMQKVRALTEQLVVGDPLDPTTQMACLVDQQHSQRVVQYIQQGQQEGADLLIGGEHQTGSCFIQPTIFDQVNAGMSIAREEIFGPVLSVIPVENIDQAIEVANSTIYGLGSAIWTHNMKQMERAAREIKAGVIWVNCHDHGDISSPVGGFKQSGFGRDKSVHALDKYVEYKTVWVDLSD